MTTERAFSGRLLLVHADLIRKRPGVIATRVGFQAAM